MRHQRPSRDRELAELLARADRAPASPDQLAALSSRIRSAAAPMLSEREARNRTLWDYAERWAGTLLPLGMLTAVAAAMGLFVLSMHREPESTPALVQATAIGPPPGTRTAILGVATNRMSSQRLIDLVVAEDGPGPRGRVVR